MYVCMSEVPSVAVFIAIDLILFHGPSYGFPKLFPPGGSVRKSHADFIQIKQDMLNFTSRRFGRVVSAIDSTVLKMNRRGFDSS